MAQNFKRVRRDVLYRHLGADTYHAGFIFDERRVHGRSKQRRIELWEFALPGLQWSALFGEGSVVRSPTLVVDRHGDVEYEHKDEVRQELLTRAHARAGNGLTIPGFRKRLSVSHRGTMSAATIYLKQMSHRAEDGETLEQLRAVSAPRSFGARCPDCGQTVCPTTCPGVA